VYLSTTAINDRHACIGMASGQLPGIHQLHPNLPDAWATMSGVRFKGLSQAPSKTQVTRSTQSVADSLPQEPINETAKSFTLYVSLTARNRRTCNNAQNSITTVAKHEKDLRDAQSWQWRTIRTHKVTVKHQRMCSLSCFSDAVLMLCSVQIAKILITSSYLKNIKCRLAHECYR